MKIKLRVLFALWMLSMVNLCAQNTYETFKNVIPTFFDSVNGDKYLTTSLTLHNEHNMSLQLSNASNDTIRLISRLKLESVSLLNFILICTSDSCVRQQTQAFDFRDESLYRYTHIFWNNYNSSTGEFNCSYMNMSDNTTTTILPNSIIYVPIDFIPQSNKYTFLKVQLRLQVGNKWYTIQQETNSILW